MKKDIYLDHAATTFVRQEVIDEMIPYMGAQYGNPSSLHSYGTRSRKAIEDARERIAGILRAQPAEIYFTSGGTESDNWAIKGAAYANRTKGKHIVTSAIEHPAVLNSCKELEKDGFEVTYLKVDEYGTVDIRQLKKALRDDTILVSIMLANNEIGTIEPIQEIGRIVKETSKAIFHVDAVQAAGAVEISLDTLPADMMSLSAHKFYGPKGTGALFIRKGVRVRSLHSGGEQESGKRAGTENVPGIVGMAKALELAASDMKSEGLRQSGLRDRLIRNVLSNIENARLNGHKINRLPNNASFIFEGIEGESLIMRLSAMGIAASTGSACSSASLEPSHVLLALGLPHEIAHGSCRMTLGRETTEEDIDFAADALKKVVAELREISPLWEDRTAS